MTDVTPVAPRGTLAETEMKAQLSLAHISMIAANAGVEILDPRVDYNGVDLTLRSYAKYPGVTGAELDVQLKCTSQQELQHTKHISWSLERQSYIKLADPERYSPAALAVLVVPDDYDQWLDQTEERLLARSCMYFSQASTWEPIDDDAGSKTVRCLRTDMLNVLSLLELMRLSAEAKVMSFS